MSKKWAIFTKRTWGKQGSEATLSYSSFSVCLGTYVLVFEGFADALTGAGLSGCSHAVQVVQPVNSILETVPRDWDSMRLENDHVLCSPAKEKTFPVIQKAFFPLQWSYINRLWGEETRMYNFQIWLQVTAAFPGTCE